MEPSVPSHDQPTPTSAATEEPAAERSGSFRPGRMFTYLLAHRKALSTSVFNQGLSSATNFALAFVLVRVLSTADYGAYSIGVAVCYLYAGVGNSLFLIQMVVHTPDRSPSDRSPYAVRMLVAVLLFALATLLVSVVGAYTVTAFVPSIRPYAAFAACVATASVCFVVKDYFVRQAYLVRAEGRAFAVTSSIAVALGSLLALAHVLRIAITADRALLIFAASQLAGAAMGLARAHLPLRSFRWTPLFNDLSECWHHGRWAIGSSLVGWSQSQAYAYLTVLIAGAAAVGRANAARLLVSPFLLLTPAINQVTMPRLADMREGNPRRMLRTGTAITLGLVALGAVYSGLLLIGSETVVPAVLGPKYTNMLPLVAAWCAVLLTMLMRDGATTLFQTMKRFRALTTINIVSALVSIVSVLALMRVWGVAGAILGGAAGELTQAALLWRNLRREMLIQPTKWPQGL